MSETPALETRQLVYAVDGKTILHGIDLRVDYGEVVGIMGASGSGKTTLLKCLCGLVKPTAGEVWVEGVNIAPLSERERMPLRLRLGIVFQYAALFDYLTVFQNVAFGLERHRRLSKAQIREIVRERLRGSGWRVWKTSTRRSCQAGCASGSAWRARWRWTRTSCCSTNPPAA
jgi:phospholipid/cholesterol/gamma-HCH transport system ATP-binding protein